MAVRVEETACVEALFCEDGGIALAPLLCFVAFIFATTGQTDHVMPLMKDY